MCDASTAPLALTFILPTRNRRAYVCRAIESCLRVNQPGIHVEVLVVDGHSMDGTFEELLRRYENDSRVRIIRQEGPKGFMPACLFAVPQVRSSFATFMYDDDALSPFWGDMPSEMKRRQANFVMGFSVTGRVDEDLPIQRVNQVRVVQSSFLLRAYFGFGRQLSNYSLPFSPVCCLTRTEWLHEWLSELKQFTLNRPMREYFMMQRNAGPDLMIYLLSISNHQGELPVFDGPVAQFSAHATSMTSELEPTDLLIGYWLGGVWLCDRLRRQNRHADAGWCAAYAVRQGLRLALKRLRRARPEWFGPLFAEISGLFLRTLVSGGVVSFLQGGLAFLLPRSWRPQFGRASRIEQLRF